MPGQDFDASKLDADFVKRVPEARLRPDHGAVQAQRWRRQGHQRLGLHHQDRHLRHRLPERALVTAIGLGANRPQDAVYPTSLKDARTADAYDGANKYVLRFPKGQLPPVQGFWSLTMYDENYFFVENPINRYSISARQDLKANADGSIDLYIQNESPGADKESNWLPAPEGQVRSDAAALLAEREQSVDPRRFVEDSGGDKAISLIAPANPWRFRHGRGGPEKSIACKPVSEFLLQCGRLPTHDLVRRDTAAEAIAWGSGLAGGPAVLATGCLQVRRVAFMPRQVSKRQGR